MTEGVDPGLRNPEVGGEVELAFASALTLAALIRKGDVSPVELVDLYLRRIDRLDPELGAYITVAGEMALEQARAAESRLGEEDLPPFHGVPISIKDLNDTAGIRTTMGVAEWRDRIPDADDNVCARLKRGGFIVLGKTNTPELGSGIVTESPGYGPCRNPWDTSRNAGGSSGGAAASLAAGLCPLSQGSDGGGSIRIPAAWCGVFGLKPARGRVSSAPRAQSLLAQPGPLTRTVADAAAVLDLLVGYEPGDAFWAGPPDRRFLEEVGRPPATLRVAVSSCRLDVAPGQMAAVDRAVTVLEGLGHRVEEADPDRDWCFEPMRTMWPFTGGEMAALEDVLPPLETLYPINRWVIERGRSVLQKDVTSAQASLNGLLRRIGAFFVDYDVLLTPAVAASAPRVGYFASVPLEDVYRQWWTFSPFSTTWNWTGQPAASVPFGFDEEGLPAAIQLVGGPAGEATILRLSAALEEAMPWSGHRPPIATA